MRFILLSAFAAVISLAMPASLHADNLFKNADLSNGLAGWHGDGRLTYLAADGSEVDDAGPNITPVIKLRLSHDSQATTQEFEVRDNPPKLTVSVEVMGSHDFRRSTDASAYDTTWSAGGTWYWSVLATPTVDFWIRGAPGFFYKLADVKVGQWTTVNGRFENLKNTDSYAISFCTPPGDGAIYIKNPSASAGK